MNSIIKSFYLIHILLIKEYLNLNFISIYYFKVEFSLEIYSFPKIIQIILWNQLSTSIKLNYIFITLNPYTNIFAIKILPIKTLR